MVNGDSDNNENLDIDDNGNDLSETVYDENDQSTTYRSHYEISLGCLVIKISDSLVMKEKEIQLLLEEGNMEINTNLDTNENEDAKFLIHDTDSNQIEKGDSASKIQRVWRVLVSSHDGGLQIIVGAFVSAGANCQANILSHNFTTSIQSSPISRKTGKQEEKLGMLVQNSNRDSIAKSKKRKKKKVTYK